MGVKCESIIAFGTTVNNETEALAALAPTSLTTRTGWGKPKITHAMALTSTDDVQECWVVPSGYADPNGFPIEQVGIYSNVSSFDLSEAKLAHPVEVPENCALTINARSETAANSVVFVWLMLEYPSAGPFEPIRTSGGLVRRAWEHGAALVSNTIANSTTITDLQAGRMYQPAGVGNGAINGATAGCVGPAFWAVQSNHSGGCEWFIPIPNAGNYVVGNGPGWVDFVRCGIKAPIIPGGQPLLTKCVGYTAEQPQAVIEMMVDKVFP